MDRVRVGAAILESALKLVDSGICQEEENVKEERTGGKMSCSAGDTKAALGKDSGDGEIDRERLGVQALGSTTQALSQSSGRTVL